MSANFVHVFNGGEGPTLHMTVDRSNNPDEIIIMHQWRGNGKVKTSEIKALTVHWKNREWGKLSDYLQEAL